MKFWTGMISGLFTAAGIALVVAFVMTLAACEPANGPTDPCQPSGCVVPRASLR
jgi:hypothetical protein